MHSPTACQTDSLKSNERGSTIHQNGSRSGMLTRAYLLAAIGPASLGIRTAQHPGICDWDHRPPRIPL